MLPLRYRIIGDDRLLRTDTAWTTFLSNRNVLIESEDSLPLERRVELWIEWPARLENKIGLTLRIDGLAVSAAGAATDIELLEYEFRRSAFAPED